LVDVLDGADVVQRIATDAATELLSPPSQGDAAPPQAVG